MKLSKQTIETIKTVVIAVLVTMVVAFVCGMKYQVHNQSAIDSAVKAAIVQPKALK